MKDKLKHANGNMPLFEVEQQKMIEKLSARIDELEK